MRTSILLTRQCNMRCTYCYNKHESLYMSKEVADDVITFLIALDKELPDDDDLTVDFIGGETLLNFPVMRHIIEGIKGNIQHRLLIRLTTNLTICSKEILRFFRENKDMINFTCSCDGIASEHDRHRVFTDGSPTHAIVKKNLKRFLEIFPRAHVNMRYADDDLEELWQGIVELHSMGVKGLNAHGIMFYGYDVKKQADIRKKICDRYIEFIKQGNELIIESFFIEHNDSYACGAGQHLLSVDERGDIYPCYVLSTQYKNRIGNVKEGFTNEKYFFSYRIIKYARKTGPSGYGKYCYAENVINEEKGIAPEANPEVYSARNDLRNYIHDSLVGCEDLLHENVARILGKHIKERKEKLLG